MRDNLDIIRDTFTRRLEKSKVIQIKDTDTIFEEVEGEDFINMIINLEDFGYIKISHRYKNSNGVWIRKGEQYGNFSTVSTNEISPT